MRKAYMLCCVLELFHHGRCSESPTCGQQHWRSPQSETGFHLAWSSPSTYPLFYVPVPSTIWVLLSWVPGYLVLYPGEDFHKKINSLAEWKMRSDGRPLTHLAHHSRHQSLHPRLQQDLPPTKGQTGQSCFGVSLTESELCPREKGACGEL